MLAFLWRVCEKFFCLLSKLFCIFHDYSSHKMPPGFLTKSMKYKNANIAKFRFSSAIYQLVANCKVGNNANIINLCVLCKTLLDTFTHFN